MPPGSGEGAELTLWSDASGTPGMPFLDLPITRYNELDTLCATLPVAYKAMVGQPPPSRGDDRPVPVTDPSPHDLVGLVVHRHCVSLSVPGSASSR